MSLAILVLPLTFDLGSFGRLMRFVDTAMEHVSFMTSFPLPVYQWSLSHALVAHALRFLISVAATARPAPMDATRPVAPTHIRAAATLAMKGYERPQGATLC